MIDFNAYFKTITEKYKPFSDEIGRKVFFREYSSNRILLDNSDFLNEISLASDTVLVSIFNGDRRDVGGIDNPAVISTGSIFLVSRIGISSIDEVRSKLNGYWNDILTKIKRDIRSTILPIRNFQWEITSLGNIADNYYGIAVYMSYGEGECETYNTMKWVE